MRVAHDSVWSRLSHNTCPELLSSSLLLTYGLNSCNSVNIRAIIERLVTVFDLLFLNYVGHVPSNARTQRYSLLVCTTSREFVTLSKRHICRKMPNTILIMWQQFVFRIAAHGGLQFRLFSVHSPNFNAPHSKVMKRYLNRTLKISLPDYFTTR